MKVWLTEISAGLEAIIVLVSLKDSLVAHVTIIEKAEVHFYVVLASL